MNFFNTVVYLLIAAIVRTSSLERMSQTLGPQPDRSRWIRHNRDESRLPSYKFRRDNRMIRMSKVYVNDRTLAPKRGIEKKRNPEFRNLWKQHSLLIARNKGGRNRMPSNGYSTVWIPFGWDVYRTGRNRGAWKQTHPMRTSIQKVQRINSRLKNRKLTTQNSYDTKTDSSDFKARREHLFYSFHSKGQNPIAFRLETRNHDNLVPEIQPGFKAKSSKLGSREQQRRGLEVKTRQSAHLLDSTIPESTDKVTLHPGFLDLGFKTKTQHGKAVSSKRNDGVNIRTLDDDLTQARDTIDRKERDMVQEFRGLPPNKAKVPNSGKKSTHHRRDNDPSQYLRRFYSKENFQGKEATLTSHDFKDGVNLNDNARNFTKRRYTDKKLIDNLPDSSNPKIKNESRAYLVEKRRQDVIKNNQRRRILFEKMEQRRKMMMARKRHRTHSRRLSVHNDKGLRDGSGTVVSLDTESIFSRADEHGHKIKDRSFRRAFADKTNVRRERFTDSTKIYGEGSLPKEDVDDRTIKYLERYLQRIRSIRPEIDDTEIGKMNKKRQRFQKERKNRSTLGDLDFRNLQAAKRDHFAGIRNNRHKRQKDRNIESFSRLTENSFGRSDLAIIPRNLKHEQLFVNDLYGRGRDIGEDTGNGVSRPIIKERVLAEVFFRGRTQSQKSKKSYEDPIIIRIMGDYDGRQTVQITVAYLNF